MSPDPEPPEVSLPPELPSATEAAAIGAAAHAAAGHGHHGPFHTHCENCGTKLEGPWCHRCGQHDFEFHRSFWHVFLEALETIFHFEGKFFRNIVTLLFQPGRLTLDFNAGRRAAQMPPFRLYIFVSFVFFLLVSLGGDKAAAPAVNRDDDEGVQRVYTSADWQEAFNDAAEKLPPAEREELARLAGPGVPPASTAKDAEDPEIAKPKAASRQRSEFEQFINDQVQRLADPEKRHQLVKWIQAHVPHMMMFCLPLFALYTRLLFRKAGLVYLQHLVVAVHFHTFVYLWVLFTQGWTGLAGLPGWGLDGWVAFAGNTWLCLYPFLMLRRLFGSSWPKTVLKTGLLTIAYTLTLSFGFLLTAVIAFFLT